MKRFIRKKVINGKEYFYEITPYYDPETKKTRQKSKYLGKNVDGKPKRVRSRDPRTVLSYGEFIPLLHVVEELKLEEFLHKILSKKDAKTALLLAINRVVRPLPLYHVSSWCEGTILSEWDAAISSQSLSKYLDKLGGCDTHRFSAEMVNKLDTSSTLLYDITSLSSYSKMKLMEYGYNRDRDKLPQVNLSLVVDKEKGIPVMYDVYPGSIRDVTTLKNTVKKIKALGIDEFVLIMDRGFYSSTNIEELSIPETSFIIAAPLTVKEVKQLVTSIHKEIGDPNLMQMYNKETLFVKPVTIQGLNGYCYYNPRREQEERDSFYKGLHAVVNKLRETKLRKRKAGEVVREIARNYYPYIQWKVVDRRFEVKVRKKAVAQRVNRMGKFVLLYKGNFSWNECLSLYKSKDVVEKVFDTLKNDIETAPMNVKKDGTLRGLVFICFLATIIRTRLMKLMSENKLNEKYTVDGMLLELEKIKRTELSNGEIITSELTAKQNEILDKLGLCA